MAVFRDRPVIKILALLALLSGGIVALPCETFRINLANFENEPVDVRISMRNVRGLQDSEVIWSGTIEGGTTEHLSFSLPISDDLFTFQFRYPHLGQSDWANEGGVVFWAPPLQVMPFILRLSSKGADDATIIRHPVIYAFDSKIWRFLAFSGVYLYRGARCLDCVVLRYFKSDGPVSRQK